MSKSKEKGLCKPSFVSSTRTRKSRKQRGLPSSPKSLRTDSERKDRSSNFRKSRRTTGMSLIQQWPGLLESLSSIKLRGRLLVFLMTCKHKKKRKIEKSKKTKRKLKG